jgi:hypothetical protein
MTPYDVSMHMAASILWIPTFSSSGIEKELTKKIGFYNCFVKLQSAHIPSEIQG